MRAAGAVSLRLEVLDRAAVDHVEIQQAIVVVVEPAKAAAVDFHYRALSLAAADRDSPQAGARARIPKSKGGGWCLCKRQSGQQEHQKRQRGRCVLRHRLISGGAPDVRPPSGRPGRRKGRRGPARSGRGPAGLGRFPVPARRRGEKPRPPHPAGAKRGRQDPG